VGSDIIVLGVEQMFRNREFMLKQIHVLEEDRYSRAGRDILLGQQSHYSCYRLRRQGQFSWTARDGGEGDAPSG
jgi:hypothetical protein